jgi:D-beta-D-heptose 7-phosphate kinase / D-beta-D-heptose 1-phosphate adenosyltransferase
MPYLWAMNLSFANPSPRILVVGDLMLDHYLWGSCSRISPEAPVQVLDVQRDSFALGGAGNVVANLLALGAQVEVASVLGPDDTGQQVAQMLAQVGAGGAGLVYQPGRQTSRKSRLMAANQQVLRFDRESREEVSAQSQAALLAHARAHLPTCDLVLLSDYGKGVLSPEVCQGIIGLANALGKPVLADPKGHDYRKYAGAYLITPNRKEASQATGLAIADQASLQQAGNWLREHLGLRYAVITLSEEGMAYFGPGEFQKIPTKARDVYDVTGAGDTVLAALGFALANGLGMADACHFANYAAAVVVGKVGSATATLAEVGHYMATEQGKAEGSEPYLKSREQMAELARQLRAQGRKIVFTNGCFDVLHLGHAKYLEQAKLLGDVLVVGVNDDASVRRLKGPTRPLNPEYDRAYLLAALGMVDYVVIFAEDTPYELIRAIGPDVLVKGGDYAGKEIVGSNLVPEVRLIDFVAGRSSTRVIDQLRNG